jgi:peptidoglycan hydrolase-like protein with peptidoglycan-binding domain
MTSAARRAVVAVASVAAVAAVALGAVGATYAIGHRGRAAASPRPTSPSVPARHRARVVTSRPLEVLSISPASGATGVAATSPITVTFSAPPATSAPKPSLSPALPGRWTQAGDSLTFTPQGGFVPYTTVTVTVPGGVATPVAHVSPLTAPVTSRFQVAPGSPLRLQQLLAELGYLPLTFTPATPEGASATTVSSSPVAGSWAWRYPSTPASLKALWKPGAGGVMTQGAVMAFESDHGQATDGVAGPQVWAALLAATAAHRGATHPYDYVAVSEGSPETLDVWSAGRIVASSRANTGVAGAATPHGTWPVYARYRATTMTGTDPNGVHYNDPGVPWVAYFFGGDAVHGFVRPGYGYPQSNGCVELPLSVAPTVWSLDPIGTLVTVS